MALEPGILKGRTYLLGIGAQKAGTTWLYEYLDAHPNIAMSPVKEMHFWGYRGCGPWEWPVTHFRKRLLARREADAKSGVERPYGPLRERIHMQGDVKLYRRFFRRRVTHEPVFGEITPAYAHLPAEEFAFINGHFARVKVVFLMRNPADRFWSQMRFSENVETLEALEDRVDRCLAQPKYYERGDYARTLAHITGVFRRDQLFI
ncbi:MAG: sulfotransferase domain-containing protein, partial [Pseudomonadota bacterium]